MNNNTYTFDNIVSDGLTFLKSLTEHYGPDKAQVIFDGMCDAVDPEIKGAILFALLSGHSTNTITLQSIPAESNFIQIIKDIRNATGLGLQETKNLCDAVRSYSKPQRITVSTSKQRSILTRDLASQGCVFD